MNDPFAEIRDHFLAALERDGLESQLQYATEHCAHDVDLRAKLEEMLRAHHQTGGFLASQAEATQNLAPLAEKPGTQIGPYKLLQQIGEGGMGTVYMAEQSHPVQRKVALKVIKAGMDSGQVIARFEAERQALALMDHPNIAKVLDAGTTAAGRPYFVMELVKGVPITTYCDENYLPPKARLELFTLVCQAVQHAHQKGIIHRDIKPSNVLVTLYDDKPVPKVIDFGVAKATGGRLTERTMFTGYGQIVGTLEYMSPEQARLNALDIDTRGDIYSLGVLLYELLTGTTPFDKQRLREAAFDEMLRMIREDEPPKPSTRLSTAEGRASIAANRSMEPHKLSGLVRGELDWIVMKALEKDRNRRYETANGFAADVLRYLHDEAVLACPPALGYRLRKFVRRNKGPVLAASLVFLALVGGIIGTTLGLVRAELARQAEAEQRQIAQTKQREALAAAEKERQATQREAEQRAIAESRRQSAEQQRQAADEARQRATDNLQLARQAVDQMLTEVGQNELANVPQMEPLRRALLEKALQFYQEFLERNPNDPGIRQATGQAYQRIGRLYDKLGQYATAERTLRDSIRVLEALVAEYPQDPTYVFNLANNYRTLANVFTHLEQRQEAEQAARQSVVQSRKLTAGFPERANYRKQLSDCLTQLAAALAELGRSPEAEEAFREAISLQENLVADDASQPGGRRSLAVAYQSLADLLAKAGRTQEADEARRRAAEIHEKLVSDFPSVPEYRHSLAHYRLKLGLALWDKRQFLDAEKELQAAIELDAKAVDDFPKMTQFRAGLAESQFYLAGVCRHTNRPEKAEQLYRQALDNQTNLLSESPGRDWGFKLLSDILFELTNLLLRTGKQPQAEALNRQHLQLLETLAADSPQERRYAMPLAITHFNLGGFLRATERSEEAEQHFDQLLKIVPNSSDLCSNFAWMLATSADEKLREPRRAVELARKAVELDPKSRSIWNTLGAAHYRAGDWQAAIEALEKSMELRQGGDSFDWFFLSMAHWQLDDKDQARQWYDKAVAWMEKNSKDNQELQRFRTEAAELLELEKKKE